MGEGKGERKGEGEKEGLIDRLVKITHGTTTALSHGPKLLITNENQEYSNFKKIDRLIKDKNFSQNSKITNSLHLSEKTSLPHKRQNLMSRH